MISSMDRPVADTPEAIKSDILKGWLRSLDRRLDLIAMDLDQRKRGAPWHKHPVWNWGNDWSELLDRVNRLIR
jgi:hypothetical protein